MSCAKRLLLCGLAFAEPPADDAVPEEVQRLLKDLYSRNQAAQIEAARALGRHKGPRVERALVFTASLTHKELRRAAALGLRQIEGPRTATSDRVAKIEMPAQVRELAIAMGSSYPVVRACAAWQLAELGPTALPALPFLLDALEDDEYECEDDLAEMVSTVVFRTLPKLGRGVVDPALALVFLG